MLKATKLALLLGALAILPASSAFAAMTAEQCDAAFVKADTNKDGAIGANEDSKKYEEAMAKNSLKVKNAGVVSKDEFMDACAKGTFDGM